MAATPDQVDQQVAGDVHIDPELAEAYEKAREAGEEIDVIINLEAFDHREFRDGGGDVGDRDAVISAVQSHADSSQQELISETERTSGISFVNQFWIANVVLVSLDPAERELEELAGVSGVVSLHANGEIDPPDDEEDMPDASREMHGVGDSSGFPSEWNLERINATTTWDRHDTKGDGVRVAVFDTGIDVDHPDLDLYTRDPNDPTYPGGWVSFDQQGYAVESEPADDGGHGTRVSGVVAGGDNSGVAIGVAPEADLLAAQIGSFASVLSAFQWAITEDADAISASTTLGTEPSIEAAENARTVGIPTAAAIGNNGEGVDSKPANFYNTIGVGASTYPDEIRTASGGRLIDTNDEWGSSAPSWWPAQYISVSVVAPGGGVETTDEDGEYTTAGGTSISTPHVGGAMALIQSATNHRYSPAAIEQALEETAWKPDEWDEADAEWQLGTRDSRYGDGIIDVGAAIEVIEPTADDDPKVEVFEVTDYSDIDLDVASFSIEWVVDHPDLDDMTVNVDNVQENTQTTYVDQTGDEVYETFGSGGDVYEIELVATTSEGRTVCERFSGFANGQALDRTDCTGDAEYVVTDIQVTDTEYQKSDDLEVEYEVENVGDGAGYGALKPTLDGTEAGTEAELVDLDPGETTTVEFDPTLYDFGTFEVGATLEVTDDTSLPTIDVLPNDEIVVESISVDRPHVLVGETVTATYDLRNHGPLPAEDHLVPVLRGVVLEEKNTTIELDPNETTTVTFDIEIDEPEHYPLDSTLARADGVSQSSITVMWYLVSDITLSSEEVGVDEGFDVDLEIENAGDNDGVADVETTFSGYSSTSSEPKAVELDAGDSKTVTFDEVIFSTGTYTVGSTADVSDISLPTVTVSDVETTEATLNEESVAPGDDASVDVELTNWGDDTVEHTVGPTLDGEPVDGVSETVTLSGGDVTTVSFEFPVDEPGEYEVGSTIATAGGVTEPILSVVDFQTTAIDVSETDVSPGDQFEIDVTVENTGPTDGSASVSPTIDGETTSSETQLTLDSGETETITFEASIDTVGEYTIGSTLEADSVAEPTVNVASLVTTDVSVDETAVLTDETLPITIEVANEGGAPAEATVAPTLEGDTLESHATDVELEGGQSTTLSFDIEVTEPGDVTVSSNQTLDDVIIPTISVVDFVVTDVAVTETQLQPDETIAVDLTVANDGPNDGAADVSVALDGESTVENETEIELESGESTTRQFEQSVPTAGEYAIESNADTEDVSPPLISVHELYTTGVDIETEALLVGENLVVDLELSNEGTEQHEATVAPELDGDGVSDIETTIELDADESTVVSFEIPTTEATEYVVGSNVGSADDVANPVVTVLDVETTDVTVSPTQVEPDEPFEIALTVENDGSTDGSIPLQPTSNSSAVLEGETVVGLDAGEQTTATFEETVEASAIYGIDSSVPRADGIHPATLTATTLRTTNVSVDESIVETGDEVTVGVEVSNLGAVSGSATVTPTLNGTALDTESAPVEVEGGDAETVSVTATPEESGVYEVASTVDGVDDLELPPLVVLDEIVPPNITTFEISDDSDYQEGGSLGPAGDPPDPIEPILDVASITVEWDIEGAETATLDIQEMTGAGITETGTAGEATLDEAGAYGHIVTIELVAEDEWGIPSCVKYVGPADGDADTFEEEPCDDQWE